MAHEISTIDGRADVAFVGEVPWHGLGQELAPDEDLTVWAEAAGFNFTIENVPALYMAKDGLLRGYPNRRTLLRSDTKEALSIVSGGYKVVQPAEVLEFFRDIIATGGFRMDVAGVLFNGARYWALAKVREGFELPGSDKVDPYLLLATGCDLQLATTAMATTRRVVCNNTLQMNLVDAEGGKIKRYLKVPHSREFDPEVVKAELGLIEPSFELFTKQAEMLAARKISDREALQFFVNVLRTEKERKEEESTFVEVGETPEEKEAEELVKGSDKKTTSAIFQLFEGGGRGSKLQSSKGTLWGAVNALTQYIDHDRPSRSIDTRVNNAWFGGGANLKEKAWEEALKMAA